MAFVECVCAWCEFGVVLSGVFEVCVSSAIAPPIIPLLVDWLQVPVTAGGPFVGDCPLAEKFTNTNTNTVFSLVGSSHLRPPFCISSPGGFAQEVEVTL